MLRRDDLNRRVLRLRILLALLACLLVTLITSFPARGATNEKSTDHAACVTALTHSAPAAAQALAIIDYLTLNGGFMRDQLRAVPANSSFLQIVLSSVAFSIPPPKAKGWFNDPGAAERFVRNDSWLTTIRHEAMIKEMDEALAQPPDADRTDVVDSYVDRFLSNLQAYGDSTSANTFNPTSDFTTTLKLHSGEGTLTLRTRAIPNVYRDYHLDIERTLSPLRDFEVRRLVRTFLEAHLAEVILAHRELVTLFDQLKPTQDASSILMLDRPRAARLRVSIEAFANSLGRTQTSADLPAAPTRSPLDLDAMTAFLEHHDRLANGRSGADVSLLAIESEIHEVLTLLTSVQLHASTHLSPPLDWSRWVAPREVTPSWLIHLHAHVSAAGKVARAHVAELERLGAFIDRIEPWLAAESLALAELKHADRMDALTRSQRAALANSVELLPSLAVLARGARGAIDLRVDREAEVSRVARDVELLIAQCLQTGEGYGSGVEPLRQALDLLAAPSDRPAP
jgi:hypothetical protein